MAFKIGIEDLVANALIENLKTDATKKFVSYNEIESYGAKVVKFLTDEQNEAILIFSRANTNQMLHDYSDFFEEIEIENKLGIKLKETATLDSLISTFRGYLTLTLLKAFINSYKKEDFN